MDIKIKHDSDHNKFFAIIAGKECSLRYEKMNNNVIDAKLMFVPKNMRGQGIASQLVEQAVNFAKKNNYRIKPTCSYVDEYIRGNAKYLPILAEDAEPVTANK
ncbi:GNAT family N-acetyltransferase [Cytophagaceae bacterium ABcell3]|nr:GNAT family N-acetyltransferase [Cytophagaceae bacterium ABcell3]